MRPPELEPGYPPSLDRPDRLDSWKQIAAYLGRSVLTAQRWEKRQGLPVRRHTHEKQDSVYAYRSELDRWWQERSAATPDDLSRVHETRDAFGKLARVRSWLSVRGRLPAVSVFVVLMAVLAGWRLQAAKVRWARERALPRIEQLLQSNYSGETRLVAYRLAVDAERYIPGDAQLEKVLRMVSLKIDIATEPPGAKVSLGSYDGSEVLSYRASPLREVRVPRGFLRWRAQKEGYESAEGIAWNNSLHIVLDRAGSAPAGMVHAKGGTFNLELTHLGQQPPFEVADYWIDRYEVTNSAFSKFVDAGGYSDPRYWKQPFSRDGHLLSFAEAMELFRDRTGRPGPATWSAGGFPHGTGDYPVTGVSWFEAMAYAEFAGKSLPTIFHWVRAAGVPANSVIVPLSNFSGSGLAAVGTYRGLNASGAYDMAGNAKEWCFNATAQGRLILGGAWNEPIYMFSEVDGQSPFSRADNFGLRLVKYITPTAPSLLAAVDYPRRDFSKETPVSNPVFKLIRGLYAYDTSPLNATVDSVDNSDEQWRKERVSFDAAYGGERVTAYVFLPRHGQAPYQTVLYFPGSEGFRRQSSRELPPPLNGATLTSGRALVIPVYKGTFERADGLKTDYPAPTDFYREHVLDWHKDLERTLDYIEARSDFDASRVAFLGFSWGARLGPIFLALDPRLKTGVLLSGGLKFAETFPEADPFNFASRVNVPVLMVNGRYDYFFPVETSQQPLFQLLGTPARDKRHVVLDAGHALPVTPVIKEVLEWLDRHLGRVSR